MFILQSSDCQRIPRKSLCNELRASPVNLCSLKWHMDVWPIKMLRAHRGWNDSAECLWSKGDERVGIYYPLPLELCTEVTNTYLSTYIRAIFARMLLLASGRFNETFLSCSACLWETSCLSTYLSLSEYRKVETKNLRGTKEEEGKWWFASESEKNITECMSVRIARKSKVRASKVQKDLVSCDISTAG